METTELTKYAENESQRMNIKIILQEKESNNWECCITNMQSKVK